MDDLGCAVNHVLSCHGFRFLPGPSRRLAPVIKCSPFLSFFQRYIVRDISLTWDIAGSLLLGVLAGSLKYIIRHFEKHEGWRTVNRKMHSFLGNDTFPSLYDAQVYERKFKSEYLERQFYERLRKTGRKIVQSLNSPFFPPHIGAEPGWAKEESRITCMRMLRTNQWKITGPNHAARVNV